MSQVQVVVVAIFSSLVDWTGTIQHGIAVRPLIDFHRVIESHLQRWLPYYRQDMAHEEFLSTRVRQLTYHAALVPSVLGLR